MLRNNTQCPSNERVGGIQQPTDGSGGSGGWKKNNSITSAPYIGPTASCGNRSRLEEEELVQGLAELVVVVVKQESTTI